MQERAFVEQGDAPLAPLQHAGHVPARGLTVGVVGRQYPRQRNRMDAVDFLHRRHHRTAGGGNDQHARNYPSLADRRGAGFEIQQFAEGKAGDQRAAHVGHPLQGARALVRQGMDRIHRRHFHQAAGGQAEPLFAQAEHQDRTRLAEVALFALAVHRFGAVELVLAQGDAVQQVGRRGSVNLAVAAMDMLGQAFAGLVAMHADAVPAVIHLLGIEQGQARLNHLCSLHGPHVAAGAGRRHGRRERRAAPPGAPAPRRAAAPGTGPCGRNPGLPAPARRHR
ncbi:Uncharacterised protein [Acinetobacter baumannii]|nr:Uncharacterised protein [Acinetobacter baumannii]